MNEKTTNQLSVTEATPAVSAELPKKKIIGEEEVRQANQILQKYKTGKKLLENKIIENEQFWKLRHWESMQKEGQKRVPASAWLWNVIVSKHADLEDSYPECGFLARARDDEEEAKRLSSIVPVVLEQNDFEETYSDCSWYKLKQGASAYSVIWDKSKLGGLGDISINKVDLLNLFWQPGITDIQKSRHLFHVELVDNEALEELYPELKDKLAGSDSTVAKYLYDDSVDTSGKSNVVDWYYHKNGKLHYVKYVNDVVLFASENDERYADGWYNHGRYPFEIDSLYDIEGSICGYGYTDINKETQLQIDKLRDSIVKNARVAATPRYFVSADGGVNVDEFTDLDKNLVHVNGNLGEDSIRQINFNQLSGNYITIFQNLIDELKETSGNRDVSNGGTQSGVTAASAIAVLQEAGSKVTRDVISTTYRAYKRIVYLVIELIRQFYDTTRTFRITGADGTTQYIDYTNEKLVPQPQGNLGGYDLGMRLPCFDIEVSPQKANPYNKMSQNELALQFYQMGFFNPQASTQALACLEVMDFNTKDKLVEKIKENGTIYDKLMMYSQLAFSLAAKYAPETAMQLQGDLMQMGVNVAPMSLNTQSQEHNSRLAQGAAASAQPF